MKSVVFFSSFSSSPNLDIRSSLVVQNSRPGLGTPTSPPYIVRIRSVKYMYSRVEYIRMYIHVEHIHTLHLQVASVNSPKSKVTDYTEQTAHPICPPS